jgi:serine phosphatase RsbU (regulator of sigma subunit)
VVAALDVSAALREAQSAPGSISDIVSRVATPLGATDVVVYIVDFAQTTLEPLPDQGMHADAPTTEHVVGSMAGRAFTDGTRTTAERVDGTRVWSPIVEGSDRTGVLAMTIPTSDEPSLNACDDLALLAGYLIATQARTTDLYNLYRRRRALSLAASMQWDLLPPLVLKTPNVTVAGLLEPAYEVGGDCFDYALNDRTLSVAVVDAMGHGVGSALISALVLGSYRHDRREGRSLEVVHTSLDEAVARYCPPLTFATGQLVQLDTESGELTWTNAGHPLPLLIRGGTVVGELQCPPTPPWGLSVGLGGSARATVATESLEPGDGVLFYTDGVIEAHEPGEEFFGLERLSDLVGRHAFDEVDAEEVLRHIVRSVLEYQAGDLADDATLVLLRWNGPTEVRNS